MDSHVVTIKQLDLFIPPKSQYGVLHHFTEALAKGIIKNKVNCRLLEAKRDHPAEFLQALIDDQPQCSISFNGLLPDKEGRFFSDLIELPHFAYLVDPPTTFLTLMKSRYTILGLVDKFWVDFVKASGFERVFFLPHGVDKSLIVSSNEERTFDVLMLSSFFDYKDIAYGWKKKLGVHICEIFEEAAHNALINSHCSFLNTVVEAINIQATHPHGHHPHHLDIVSLLDEFETYIKAKDRIELIKNITNARVDIFGSSKSKRNSWKTYFKSQSNIIAHDAIPFEQACVYMKKSKIVLNSCATLNNGAHERVLTGLASGAMVFTNENSYLSENFGNSSGIVSYHHGDWNRLNIQIMHYLAEDSLRKKQVKQGQKLLLKSHTWDSRAKDLLKELPAFLEMIYLQENS